MLTKEEIQAEFDKQRAFQRSSRRSARDPGLSPAQTSSNLADFGRGLLRGPVTALTGLVDLLDDQVMKRVGLPGLGEGPAATNLAEQFLPARPTTQAGRIAEGTSGAVAFGPSSPVRSAMTGLLGTVGAELGAGIAEQSGAEEGTSTALTLGGGLAGGLGSAGALRIAKGVGSAVSTVIPSARRRILAGQAKRLIAGQLEDPATIDPLAQQATALNRQLPGVNLSLAEISPGVRSLSEQLRSNLPRVEDAQRLRLRGNREAIAEGLRDTSSLPVGTLEGAAGRVKVVADQAKQDFERGVAEVIAPVGTRPDLGVLGQDIRKAVNTKFDAEKAKIDQLYDNFDFTIEGSTDTVKQAFAKLTKDLPKAVPEQSLGPASLRQALKSGDANKAKAKAIAKVGSRETQEVSDDLVTTRQLSEQEPLFQVRAVRTEIMQAIRDEHAKASGNKNKIRLLNKLLDATQQNIDEIVDASGSQELRQIDAQYKQLVERFRQGDVGKIFQGGVRGESERLSDTDVFNAFINSSSNKGRERLNELRAALGNDADILFEQGLLARFAQSVMTADGQANPTAINRFRKTHQALIDDIPSLSRKLNDLSSKADLMLLRSGNPATIDNILTRQLLGDDPRQAVRTMMANENPGRSLRQLTETFGNEGAGVRSISRAFQDELMNRAGIVRKSATTEARAGSEELGQLLQRQRGQLEAFYGPEHVQRLERWQKAAEFTEQSRSAIRPKAEIPKGEMESLLTRFWSRSFAIARGVIGPQFTTAEAASRQAARLIRAFDEREIRLVLDSVIHDPDVMNTLASVRKAGDIPQAQRSLKTWLKKNALPLSAATAQTEAQRRPQSSATQ